MFGFMTKKDIRIKYLEMLVELQEKNYLRAVEINNEHQKLNGQLQTRITDLENNIELLTNNLSANKKKQLGL